MEISSIILPAGFSTAAAAAPAPDQTIQGKTPTAVQCYCTHPPESQGLSDKKSRGKERKKKKRQLLSQTCLVIHPQWKTRDLLSTQEVYTINTCILNTAHGNFRFGNLLYTSKHRKNGFLTRNILYEIHPKQKLIYVLSLVIQTVSNGSSLHCYLHEDSSWKKSNFS